MSRYFSGRILPSDKALQAMAQAMDVDLKTLRDARDTPCPVNRPADPGTEYRFAMDAVLRHGKSWTTEQAAGLARAILDQAGDPHAILRKLTNEFGPDASDHSSYSLSSEGAVTDGTDLPSESSSLK